MLKMTQPLFQLNWNLLFSIITFAILYFVLHHFFFDKVHRFMEEREKSIQDSLDGAAEKEKMAEEKMINCNEQIAGLERESREIIKKARDEAKIQADSIIKAADEKAKQTISNSADEIERQKYEARRELKMEVGNLAALAAGKIMEKEIDPDEEKEIIDRVIEEAGENPWK